ncbi:MAG: undecaprenyldiphospho-muramoylpentapeptide beta-N-acetylglucosaminyltransferase [Candidatus Auribacterota bacterium]|jgi:UDP-N-acetylglucosamine--N-acetylmuramyl-(pentapeptide) pyrophosphoryl-undecaprenol N-acetylglucosamine transferase|nr:undecaprenyldiphospho-muramoylpentapeptide beta-N-acetylglucosaminyltransferase [Candidatus Auribacterota bacterium]
MKIAISAGGTGGHLFPAIALSEAIERYDSAAKVIFFNSPRDSAYYTDWKVPVYTLHATGFNRNNFIKVIRFAVSMTGAIIKSMTILKKEKPAVIIGFGGYVSFAPCVAACLLRIPVCIHEQNAVPGKVNRILASFAKIIFAGLPESEPYWKQSVKHKIKTVGIPVRSKAVGQPKSDKNDRFTVLIAGGSQGAAVFNRWLPDMLNSLSMYKDKIRFIHLLGKNPVAQTRNLYESMGFENRCFQFYAAMSEIYSVCDLAISRAGSGSLSELAIAGIPSVVIPYPFATDNHQYYNAKVFADAGAVDLIEEKNCSPEILADKIMHYFENHAILETMRVSMLELAISDAGKHIMDELKNAGLLKK